MTTLNSWLNKLRSYITHTQPQCPHDNVHVIFVNPIDFAPVEGFCKDCKKTVVPCWKIKDV